MIPSAQRKHLLFRPFAAHLGFIGSSDVGAVFGRQSLPPVLLDLAGGTGVDLIEGTGGDYRRIGHIALTASQVGASII